MKKPVTIIKAPTINNSFEDDRLSDRFSDKFSLPDRWSDKVSMPDSNIQLNMRQFCSFNLQNLVKNLSFCGDEQLTNVLNIP
jgi:hypothetical protein